MNKQITKVKNCTCFNCCNSVSSQTCRKKQLVIIMLAAFPSGIHQLLLYPVHSGIYIQLQLARMCSKYVEDTSQKKIPLSVGISWWIEVAEKPQDDSYSFVWLSEIIVLMFRWTGHFIMLATYKMNPVIITKASMIITVILPMLWLKSNLHPPIERAF